LLGDCARRAVAGVVECGECHPVGVVLRVAFVVRDGGGEHAGRLVPGDAGI